METPASAPDKVEAPWTPEQVAALNEWQRGARVHPFTCPACGDTLRATEAGWVCDGTRRPRVVQTWAHAFMAQGPPRDILAAFRAAAANP